MHTFEYRLVYDINFTNISNSKEIIFTITHRSMEFKTEFYGLNEKLKIARQRGLIFNQINKLTIENYSHQRYIDMHYYLKIQIPIMHRHFLKKNSQNPEHVQTPCNIINSPFRFAFRKWLLYIIPQY